MVFVTLGTQDKAFKRLLEMVDKAIDDKLITDEVIAQIGITKYESKNIKTFSFTSKEEMQKYIEKADYIITHGGVGTIFDSIKHDKKIIAVARLSKYKEHHNDHQLQVIKDFSNKGYILDGNNLEEAIKKIPSFKPKKYESNNLNFINKLEEYIENN